MTFLEKYADKIERIPFSGCWIWTGAATSLGYGFLNQKGKTFRVHRRVYEETYGPIQPGLFICHKCDVPACCNPNHLFAGTPRDNAMDMVRKGRRNPNST